MKFKSGFTIVELLTAIAIIGIVSAISLPIYKNLLPTIGLNTATRDVASDLRYAQQMAVTEQIIYSVIFDVAQNQYTIVKKDSGTTVRSKTLGNGIKIQSVDGITSSTINFISTGAATESGTVLLSNQQEKISTIEIKPSGYVKIQ